MTVKVAFGHGVENAVAGRRGGGIFWAGDEYPFKGDYSDDVEQLALNIVAELTGGGSKRIAYAQPSSWGAFFLAALSSAGHTVTELTNALDLTVANFDFAFLDNTLCTQAQIWAFVQDGGSVLIPLGTYNENTWWGTLFGYTGVVHPDTYVFGGLVTPNGGAPYFTGVASVYMNGGSVLSSTAPSAGGTIELFTGTRSGSTYPVFAVWKS